MEVKRILNEETKLYDYEIIEEDKRLLISFSNKKNLYFTFLTKGDNSISIDKSNTVLYNLFDKLYNDIKECNIFEVSDIEKALCNNEIDLEKIKAKKRRSNEVLKYKQKELFIDNQIRWISDASKPDKYNCVTIEKDDDKYILDFKMDDKENSFDSVCISNAGSRYTPFNKCFIKLYQSLQQYNPEVSLNDEKTKTLKLN